MKPRAVRAMPKGLKLARAGGGATSFQLFDARKRFGPAWSRTGRKVAPRLFVFGDSPFAPLFQPPMAGSAEAEVDDGLMGTQRLRRRLAAVRVALEDLPRQARRLARWQARRGRMASPRFRSPLRPGLPPGYCKEPKHEVDEVLRECHALASDAQGEDTS